MLDRSTREVIESPSFEILKSPTGCGPEQSAQSKGVGLDNLQGFLPTSAILCQVGDSEKEPQIEGFSGIKFNVFFEQSEVERMLGSRRKECGQELPLFIFFSFKGKNQSCVGPRCLYSQFYLYALTCKTGDEDLVRWGLKPSVAKLACGGSMHVYRQLTTYCLQ